MKKLTFAAVVIALAVGGAATALAQEPVALAGAGVPQGSEREATTPAGLGDLERTTFACPRAALNAAARQLRSYLTQGMFQFSHSTSRASRTMPSATCAHEQHGRGTGAQVLHHEQL
jgi:hypothetical protein